MAENDYQNQGKITLNTPEVGSINKLAGGSTIEGGSDYTAFFINYDENNIEISSVNNAVNATIHAVSNTSLAMKQGSNNTLYVDRDLGLFNAKGKVYAEVNGACTVFTQDGLDLTLDAFGNAAAFYANKGTSILKGSLSTAPMTIWGGNTSDITSTILAFGGTSTNNFLSGTGLSIFSGGTGDNKFSIIKSTCANGTTLLLNFDKNLKNQISLFGYGLDQASFANILKNAKDINGNAMITLENHIIILAGVLVENIKISQFVFG